MSNIENHQLVHDTMISDFVINHSIASLQMSQIVENSELREAFENLMSNVGFEIYMKQAIYYLDLRYIKPIVFFSIQNAVAEKGETFIDYKKNSQNKEAIGNVTSASAESIIALNLAKVQEGVVTKFSFSEENEFIVKAEDMTIRR